MIQMYMVSNHLSFACKKTRNTGNIKLENKWNQR